MNVAKLKEYDSVFNGQRIVLVKTGQDLSTPQSVKDAFHGFRAVFVAVPNDPRLGEVAGWLQALERLQSAKSDEITFYAHTKGVSYDGEPDRFVRGIRMWRNHMYDNCLQNVAQIETVLTAHTFAGCYQRPTRRATKWHYAGAFWWFKHSEFFSNPKWCELDDSRFAVEMYPGKHFEFRDGACLFDQFIEDLYASSAVHTCFECTHTFNALVKRNLPQVKVCPKCHKRSAIFTHLH